MALTYIESAALMNDPTFISRIKVACLTFAEYIVNEPSTVPAHNTRMRWATSTIQSPDSAASAVTPAVVMDPNVQAQGASISDADLQTAVETAINKMM